MSRRPSALGIAGLSGGALLAFAGVVWGQTAVPLASQEIPFASPHAAAELVPSAPNAWGGARTGSEATLSERVVKYEIDAGLDPNAHRVSGHERLTWRNRSDRRVSRVYLHLYLNAFEGPGSTFSPKNVCAGSRFVAMCP